MSHYVEKDGKVTVEPGRIAPSKIIALVGKFPEGPITCVAGGSHEHLGSIRAAALRWIEIHPLGEYEELRIVEDIPELEPQAFKDRVFDTVGQLRAWLAQYPADTPLTHYYDGTGRIGANRSYSEDDSLYCISIYQHNDSWLTAKGHALKNPTLKEWD